MLWQGRAGHGMGWHKDSVPADKMPYHDVQGHTLPGNTHDHSDVSSSSLVSPSVINYSHALLLVLHLD